MFLIQVSLVALFVAIVSELILLLLDENAENQPTEHPTSKQYTENLHNKFTIAYKLIQATHKHISVFL